MKCVSINVGHARTFSPFTTKLDAINLNLTGSHNQNQATVNKAQQRIRQGELKFKVSVGLY